MKRICAKANRHHKYTFTIHCISYEIQAQAQCIQTEECGEDDFAEIKVSTNWQSQKSPVGGSHVEDNVLMCQRSEQADYSETIEKQSE